MKKPGSEEDSYFFQRKRMVENQIRKRGICDTRVLKAMEKVKRHLFVPPQALGQAYGDFPIGIGFGQTISQPFIVAYMTEALKLDRDDKVLEIGSGCGYQAAVLAEMVQEVHTVESIQPLAEETRRRLKTFGYDNIFVYHADGFHGLREQAPFDAVIVTAAPNEIPPSLTQQLKEEGRMIIPVGSFNQELYLVTKTKKGNETKAVLPVRFVPMVKGIQ